MVETKGIGIASAFNQDFFFFQLLGARCLGPSKVLSYREPSLNNKEK